MSCGRIAFMVSCISILFPFAARAGGFCGADTIHVRAIADTVFVEHENAVMNCCLDLQIDLQVEGNVIDFYERDAGDPCHCICCFDLDFHAGGFEAGHYTVRVWDAVGSLLHGQAELDVPGAGGGPHLLTVRQGECQDPQASGETTWGKIRALYR
jgi:hypothetical protein